jgi:Tfp pilus assembly protein PilX
MRSLSHQRGIVVLWAVIFLIVGVLITLTQVYDVAGSRGVATAQQSDSTAAFFIAESGLQSAESRIRYAGNPYDECTGTTTATLGGGSFSYTAALDPAGCSATSSTCACQITSTGMVPAAPSNTASRTVQRNAKIVPGSTGGTSCASGCLNLGTTPTWSINGMNTTNFSAVAVIHLAAGRQGNPTGSTCPTTPAAESTNCTTTMKWLANASSGSSSVVSQGHVWPLASGGSTGKLWMKLNESQPSQDEPVAVHGVLFPGTTAPAFKGAYWSEELAHETTTTIDKSGGATATFTGRTNNGAATSTGTCDSPIVSSPYNAAVDPDPRQDCTNWCFGGDRLAYSVATWPFATNGTAARLSSITFNGVPLSRDIHYPDTGTQNTVYSEIWSVRNPDYLYGANTTAGGGSILINQPGVTAGLSATTSITPGSENKLVVTGTPTPISGLAIGDKITVANVPPNTKITGMEPGTTGGAGTYTMSANATAVSTAASLTSTRHILTVTNLNAGTFEVGQTLSSIKTSAPNTNNVPAGTTIVALGAGTGGIGTYFLGMTTEQAVTSTDRIITSGATSSLTAISVNSSLSRPEIGTIIAIRSGTGELSTTVTEKFKVTSHHSTLPQFSVKKIDATGSPTGSDIDPSVDLVGAQICGGTCAFFDHTNPETTFTVTKPAKQDYFASGFICISGADKTPVAISVGTTIELDRWREIVK